MSIAIKLYNGNKPSKDSKPCEGLLPENNNEL